MCRDRGKLRHQIYWKHGARGGRVGASKRYQSVYFTTDSNHVEVGWNTIAHNASCRGIQFHSSPVSQDSGFNQFDLSIHDNEISGQTCDGLNLATIDPSKGRIAVFNNVIYHVGTGPRPPDGDSSYACISSPGIVNRGKPGSGTVEIFNNTLMDCGTQGGPTAGALNVGGNSPALELKHNMDRSVRAQALLHIRIRPSSHFRGSTIFGRVAVRVQNKQLRNLPGVARQTTDPQSPCPSIIGQRNGRRGFADQITISRCAQEHGRLVFGGSFRIVGITLIPPDKHHL